jgi:hypothetical protein
MTGKQCISISEFLEINPIKPIHVATLEEH